MSGSLPRLAAGPAELTASGGRREDSFKPLGVMSKSRDNLKNGTWPTTSTASVTLGERGANLGPASDCDWSHTPIHRDISRELPRVWRRCDRNRCADYIGSWNRDVADLRGRPGFDPPKGTHNRPTGHQHLLRGLPSNAGTSARTARRTPRPTSDPTTSRLTKLAG